MATNKTAEYREQRAKVRAIVADRTEAAMGGSGGYDPVTNTQRAPKLSLVAQLLLRSQGKAQPVPKPGRGRPRKQVVAIQAFMDGSGEPEDLL